MRRRVCFTVLVALSSLGPSLGCMMDADPGSLGEASAELLACGQSRVYYAPFSATTTHVDRFATCEYRDGCWRCFGISGCAPGPYTCRPSAPAEAQNAAIAAVTQPCQQATFTPSCPATCQGYTSASGCQAPQLSTSVIARPLGIQRTYSYFTCEYTVTATTRRSVSEWCSNPNASPGNPMQGL